MQEQTVFFIGDVALDEYYEAPYFPKIKEKIIVHTLAPQMGGSIANAACVFSGYDRKERPHFMTALNTGSISKTLCDNLEKAGLDTSFMVWDDSLPDSKCIIILAEEEHTVFIPTMGLQKMEISDLAMETLLQTKYIYSNLCELKPLSYKGKNALLIMKELKENGCRIWCDLDVADITEEDLVFLPFLDTLFVNEKGQENLKKYASKALPDWLFDMGVDTFVVTKAENGCEVSRRNGENVSIPGCKVSVVDVTGAGDTFCSSFLYASLQGCDLFHTAEFANFAAARAVTGMGGRAGVCRVNEVLMFMEEMRK